MKDIKHELTWVLYMVQSLYKLDQDIQQDLASTVVLDLSEKQHQEIQLDIWRECNATHLARIHLAGPYPASINDKRRRNCDMRTFNGMFV